MEEQRIIVDQVAPIRKGPGQDGESIPQRRIFYTFIEETLALQFLFVADVTAEPANE